MNFFESVGRAVCKKRYEDNRNFEKKYLDDCHAFQKEEKEREEREEARKDRFLDALDLIANGMNK